MSRPQKSFPMVLLFLLCMDGIQAFAGGPLYVTGPSATSPGQPYRWIGNSVTYRTDLGPLGNQTNTQANALVASAFQKWSSVATANLNIQNVGQFSFNVTGNTLETYLNAISDCGDPSQPEISIIYDADGSIISAMGGDSNSTLGFTQSLCINDTAGAYTRSLSILNGRFIDGQPNTASHQTVTLDEFKAVFIHEFGHILGLDHSQINLNCLTESSCSAADAEGLPVMFPILLDISDTNLSIDDQAAISALYPASGLSATMGRIQGNVFFADGQTPAQGYNVIARQVGNPRSLAVSTVSGYLYNPWVGDPFLPDNISNTSYFGFFGSTDANLIGAYDIAGLPPGSYTVEVEEINGIGDYPFIESSSLGPIGALPSIGFQFRMPGSCARQYLHTPSSPSDSCSAQSSVTVGGGFITNTNTDVILLGTDTRYDQWEDGP